MALSRTWYNTLVNDDGSGLTGSIWDKEDVNQLMNAIDAEIARLGALSSIATAFVIRNTVQTMPNAAWEYVYFSAAFENTPPTMWSSGAPVQITIPETGHYLVQACVYFDPSGVGVRGIQLLRNGTADVLAPVFVNPVAPPYYSPIFLTGKVNISAGMTLAIQAYQTSGAGLNTGGGFPTTNYLQVFKLF